MPRQIASRPNTFVGRDSDLNRLLDHVCQNQCGAVISCVHGTGGVGKTALALVVADRLGGDYPDGQISLNLHGAGDKAESNVQPLEPAQAMARVIQSLRPDYKPPDDPEQLANDYRTTLSGKRVMLLLDNAHDGQQVRPLRPPAPCLMLVTSRRRFSLDDLLSVNLDVLSEDGAVELLLDIEPRIGPHAAEIAQLCGRLPLALCAAAHLLKATPNLSPGEYAGQLRDERTRLKNIGKEGVEADVEASLNLSYRALSPGTQRVFRCLAVWAPSATFDATSVEAVCEDVEHKELTNLVRYSLVEYDVPSERYHLHDLVRIFAGLRLDERASAERAAAERRHAEFYVRVLVHAHGLYLEGGEAVGRGLALFDRERTNIEAGQAWAEAHAAGDDDAARLCNEYPDAGVYCLYLRQHPRRERIPWLESALAAARRLKDRAAEGRHLGSLGIAYADLGDVPKAIEFHEQYLAIAREIGDRRGEGNALNNLGNAYADLGEVRKAIEFYEQRLAIAREIGDRRGEGTALGNLGLAYADLGEVRKAIEFYEQALVIDREIGDRRGEGADLGNLGLAYAALGEVRKAIDFHKQALVIHREIGDRRGEGNALNNLGNVYANLGEVPKAIEFYEQALVIAREIGDRRGEGNVLWNRSLALDKLGRRRQAVTDAEAALRIREQIEDPNTEKVRRKLEEWRKSD